MLDRKYILDHLDAVRTNCSNRGVSCELDRLIELESQRREKLVAVQELNRQANEVSKSIGKASSPEEREQRKEEGRRLREAKDQAQTDHDALDAPGGERPGAGGATRAHHQHLDSACRLVLRHLGDDRLGAFAV